MFQIQDIVVWCGVIVRYGSIYHWVKSVNELLKPTEDEQERYDNRPDE